VHAAPIHSCVQATSSRKQTCLACAPTASFALLSPSFSLCLSLLFYFPEHQFEEREKGKSESARNPGINPGACTLVPAVG
jgi:hypothetical protein